MAMIQCRNLSSRTYNERTANEIAEAVLSSFVRAFRSCLEKLAVLEQEQP